MQQLLGGQRGRCALRYVQEGLDEDREPDKAVEAGDSGGVG